MELQMHVWKFALRLNETWAFHFWCSLIDMMSRSWQTVGSAAAAVIMRRHDIQAYFRLFILNITEMLETTFLVQRDYLNPSCIVVSLLDAKITKIWLCQYIGKIHSYFQHFFKFCWHKLRLPGSCIYVAKYYPTSVRTISIASLKLRISSQMLLNGRQISLF